jgi:hypothetical protein
MGAMMLFLGGIAVLATLDVTLMGRSIWILAALAPLIWAIPTVIRCIAYEGFTGRTLAIVVPSLLPSVFVVGAILGLNIGSWWPLILIAIGLSQFGWRR